MSRGSTLATLIGDLVIASRPGSSNSDMPVTTRGMSQANRQALSGSREATLRVEDIHSQQRRTRRSGGRISRRSAQMSGGRRPQAADENNSDKEEDDSDEGDEGDAEQIVNQIMSILADTYPSPEEFSRIHLNPARRRRIFDSKQTDDCGRLAHVLTGVISRDPSALPMLRDAFPRRYCAERLINNLWRRDDQIMRNLYANLDDQASGRDVPDAISDWRRLNFAIEQVLDEYSSDMSGDHRRSLASLLVRILDRIFQADRDLYAGQARTVYAGESSGGNLFRIFLLARSEPIDFLSPLQRLNVELLASQQSSLGDLLQSYRGNGADGSEDGQYNRVGRILVGILSRATGQLA